ncbi:aldo/keto reductase [Streptomyces sp. ISL-100]|uniref:aldo/keto reductase n=1 Tax=Streptomyces sp. ISL-100 TaxID=2819173 RepID=UPI001BE8664B|nr:aldo/keto reductase [Streptomyces sp. ISL-100]MBT2396255.1 aldo/keto reductase [Streptomyces sp. ISL-100]
MPLEVGITAVDTAYNYGRYEGHRALVDEAGELLDRFEVSTKVGYFPDGHDLDPERLRAAVAETGEALGRVPDTVFLHNPEHDPGRFVVACETLAACQAAGLCVAWGIATWNPLPLVPVAAGVPVRPDVVMVRAGLATPGPVLDAAENLAHELSGRAMWGMAPFAGDPSDPVWSGLDTGLFLEPGQPAVSSVQARLAAAFAVPSVSRIAVGTSQPDHLAELAAATRVATSTEMVHAYRTLLRERAGRGKEPARAAHHG